MRRAAMASLVCVTVGASACAAAAADWPMWRGNAARTAQTSNALPASLHLRWTLQLPRPAPAWPASQPKLRFDTSYEPIVAGGRLFVPSMVADRLTAYDARTGVELWRFYADGPIRFAPVAWKTNLYTVSDDGHLYCLDAATGRARWAVRGAPDGRLTLGNERLISTWPARGAPVIWGEPADGPATVYFAASIWPFMGIFIHAIDAESGAIRWSNSGSGSVYVPQQHNSPAFAGVAPQGYLSATEDRLLVSGGRTVPAVYDRRTGEFLYYNVSDRTLDKSAGGFGVCVSGDYFINHGFMHSLSNGQSVMKVPDQVIGSVALAATGTCLEAFGLKPDRTEETVIDRRGKEEIRVRYSLPLVQSIPLSLPLKRFHSQAGGRIYASASGGLVGAVTVAGTDHPAITWTGRVDGEVWSMIPADGRLYVVTEAGAIHCFGADAPGRPVVHAPPATPGRIDVQSPPRAGYAMVWGLGPDAFARVTRLAADYHVVAIDPDADAVAALRRRLDDAGLYGRRVHVLAGRPAAMRLPPYMASLIEFGDLATAGLGGGTAFVRRVFQCLRPYGGAAVFAGSDPERAAFEHAFAVSDLPNAILTPAPDGVAWELRRDGPLPGSASWTHQYADAANSVMSRDRLVEPPLGLLWFGGPSHDDVLPRHGHGPSPHVIGGRLFIEGADMLRAIDVYTGRLLWQRPFEGLGQFYDNTSHQPGAGEIGGNYASAEDGIYVAYGKQCLRLDPATGRTLDTFTLPRQPGLGTPHWGYIGIYEDLLLAGASPLAITEIKPAVRQQDDDDGGRTGKSSPAAATNALPLVERNAPYASSSLSLVALDRHSGRVLWSRPARQAFRHNAIAAGGGMVFCVDAITPTNRSLLQRRGEEPATPPELLALDAHSGAVVWQTTNTISATWLGYSTERDVLLVGGSPARDRAADESRAGLSAYRGRDGQLIWHTDAGYRGTPILHSAAIYTDGLAFDWDTGRRVQRRNPITGATTNWSFARGYGCNTPIGSEHMLLFRSAAAGFYDLRTDGGTANWGGFKSGCTPNLIAADGILTVPDYTRTCLCSYQDQCSLALVPMPDVEVWAAQDYDQLTGRVARVGINFGAPGDWRAPDGTLWLDYPSVGGKSPQVPVAVDGPARYFRRHAMEVEGPAAQVTASGVEDARTIRVGLNATDERRYTVRLYFAEPDSAAAGERVFDVTIQDRPALAKLDVAAEAGGRLKGLVKEFRGVTAGDSIVVALHPAATSRRPPLICGVAVALEPTVEGQP